jgi:serpin B
MALGNAGLLQPAPDNGALAGNEINDFGFDLLRRLDSTGNLCASPTSTALALAMVRPGARGLTASEMDKVLHGFGSDGQASEVVALLKELQSQTAYDNSGSLPTDPGTTPAPAGQQPVLELDVFNAVFSQRGMSLEPAYLDSLSSGFGAGVGLLDFANYPKAARQIINGWASDRTKGRIPEASSRATSQARRASPWPTPSTSRPVGRIRSTRVPPGR